MKTFILIIVGICLLGLGVLMTTRRAGHDFRETGIPKLDDLMNPVGHRKAKDPAAAFEQAQERVKDVTFDKGKFVGAWKSSGENSELLVLRKDGVFRLAMAADYEFKQQDGRWQYMSSTAIFLGNWRLVEGRLELNNMKLKDMRIWNVRMSGQEKGDTIARGKARDANELLRKEAPKRVRESLIQDDRVMGAVVRLTETKLVLVHEGGTSSYDKVDPYSVKDPNGVKAPTYVVSVDGEKVTRKKKR